MTLGGEQIHPIVHHGAIVGSCLDAAHRRGHSGLETAGMANNA